jgi:hypothetical protein
MDCSGGNNKKLLNFFVYLTTLSHVHVCVYERDEGWEDYCDIKLGRMYYEVVVAYLRVLFQKG